MLPDRKRYCRSAGAAPRAVYIEREEKSPHVHIGREIPPVPARPAGAVGVEDPFAPAFEADNLTANKAREGRIVALRNRRATTFAVKLDPLNRDFILSTLLILLCQIKHFLKPTASRGTGNNEICGALAQIVVKSGAKAPIFSLSFCPRLKPGVIERRVIYE